MFCVVGGAGSTGGGCGSGPVTSPQAGMAKGAQHGCAPFVWPCGLVDLRPYRMT
ncbi:hypothetical protein [Acetobacter syzygii]|uniref:hypothetical protein n=1 Tax=Acetobacter syzygii TaxID=146476 RepID=UPI00156EB8D6|nr:hypothetical protein [Acetobacter syzygii]NSL93717.1 hypothetical protein [Acetobacter syzygii]